MEAGLKSGNRNRGFVEADAAASRKNSGSKNGGGMPRLDPKFVKSFEFSAGTDDCGANILGIEFVKNLLSNNDTGDGNGAWEGLGDLLLLLLLLLLLILERWLLSKKPLGLWCDEFVFGFLEFFISLLLGLLFDEGFPKDGGKEFDDECRVLCVLEIGDSEDDGLESFDPFSSGPVVESTRVLCLESN